MDLRNLAPDQKISIKISNWTHKTTVQEYSQVIADPRYVESVNQGLQSLDDGLEDTINLVGVAGFWNGVETSIDLI